MSQRTSTPRQSNTPDDDTPGNGRISTALGPFGMVPAGVIESGLSDAAVRLYAYLWRRTQNDNHGRPSLATIGKDLGWSREKAKKTMKELRDVAGLVTVVARFDADGGQETNDYVLEWSSDFAPVVPYPDKAPRPSRNATEPLFSPADVREQAAEQLEGGGVTADPGVQDDPGGAADPRVPADPQGGTGRPPKKTTTPSPITRGASDPNGERAGGTASPATRAADAWADAYGVAHSTPATPVVVGKVTRTALELLDQHVPVEVVIAAARAAGSAGDPWVDRFVAKVTRVPGTLAAGGGRGPGQGRTYGATVVVAPTPTAPRAEESCKTHPGNLASNCSGCRADALAAR